MLEAYYERSSFQRPGAALAFVLKSLFDFLYKLHSGRFPLDNICNLICPLNPPSNIPFKELRVPFKFQGADDAAGPNYTKQPAVNSYYE